MPLTPWREAVTLPILPSFQEPAWNLDDLYKALEHAHHHCGNAVWNPYITLCLSGGLDSSLSLAILVKLFGARRITACTIGSDPDHPDVRYAKMAAETFGVSHAILIPTKPQIDRAKIELAMIPGEDVSDGNAGVLLFYQFLNGCNIKKIISHDGIDELVGGYWPHRQYEGNENLQCEDFDAQWKRLADVHLHPLERKALICGVDVVFPYLQREVIEYIRRIPLCERTSKAESKMPLRALARRLGVPEPIIARRKIGFCSALALPESLPS
ncbi:TPA: hypothetical protein DEP34_04950 [Candidatus Uhrbacteria bacterium]|uniref:Asparagine synthetase n=1 Tax=Candidatus Uhrbacteria bacterium GW2011_GWE2_46_68 TaxID=1618994 RepID=A0A0G1T5N1_9BACT|nr:MAG: Asparagine synthetase [Candidatus Uhrbacteria bacterium GW2011_GWE2_46_68]HBK33597.1 hypothetical protein [Candidatus Uhrbacteria bacterium]HCB19688.1 hypothetical protein [Candidatus Uhrbacteria bacterium]